jgi:hypothetical protein
MFDIDTNPELITLEAACEVVSPGKPISKSTYRRGAAVGRFPPILYVSPQLPRVNKPDLLRCLNKLVAGANHKANMLWLPEAK